MVEILCCNDKTSVLCSGGGGGKGGGIVWCEGCCNVILDNVSDNTRLPFVFIVIGRGGIGGGVEDVIPVELWVLLFY